MSDRTRAGIARSIIYAVAATLLLIGGVYLLLLTFAPTLSETPVIRDVMRRQVEATLERPASQAGDRLYIPKLGINIAIVTGNDESALLKGAWHRKPENGNPRDGGNFVLSAHRFDMGLTPAGTIQKSPFYHIDQLETGDEVAVDYNGTRYDYTVTRTYRVKPDAVTIEHKTDDPRLTLYSCTLRGSADGREVVEAVPATQR